MLAFAAFSLVAILGADADAADPSADPAAPPERLACFARHHDLTPTLEHGAWVATLPDGARLPWNDGKRKTFEQRLDSPTSRASFSSRITLDPFVRSKSRTRIRGEFASRRCSKRPMAPHPRQLRGRSALASWACPFVHERRIRCNRVRASRPRGEHGDSQNQQVGNRETGCCRTGAANRQTTRRACVGRCSRRFRPRPTRSAHRLPLRCWALHPIVQPWTAWPDRKRLHIRPWRRGASRRSASVLGCNLPRGRTRILPGPAGRLAPR